MRPPGTAANTSQAVTRNNVAAFNVTTGALVTGFNPNVNGKVNALAVSPDGSRLYIGGKFKSVGGTTRNRIAAVNPSRGAVVTTFNPNAGSAVNGLAVTSTKVYFGGPFRRSAVKPVLARGGNPTTGAVNTSFKPVLDQRPDQLCTPGFVGCPESGVLVTKRP